MSNVVPESWFSSHLAGSFSKEFRLAVSLLWDSTLAEADHLLAIGLNVFPQPYGQKKGTPWQALQYTRLNRFDLPNLFDGKCNVAVMTGRTSRNLFVIDCESEAAFNYHLLEASKRKLAVWVVKTARGGHLWFLCAAGEVNNIKPGTIPDAEIRGHGGYVLCPPSRHPSGVDYTWFIREGEEPPTVTPDQIDWLIDRQGQPVRLKARRTQKGNAQRQANSRAARLAAQLGLTGDPRMRQLSNAALEYLEQGRQVAEGERNNRLFNAACDLAGCGFSADEATRLLHPIALASGLEDKEIRSTLRSAYRQPRTPSRPHAQDSASARPQDWQHALAYINAISWLGRTGTSDRTVARALGERAKLSTNERGVFRGSERELAELARMSRVTTRKALKRLQERHFIFKVGHDQTSRATLWRFGGDMLNKGKSFSQTDPLLSLPKGGDPSGSVLYKSDGSGTDAAERGALNATGMRVFEAMRRLGRPARAKVIRAEAKVSLGQVYGSLRKLKGLGLVEHPKRNSWKLSKRAAKLDDLKALDELVAEPAGTLGKGQRRAQKFAEERASHAAQTILVWRAKRDAHFRLRSTKCPHCGHVVWHHRSLVLGQCPRCGEALVAETPQRRGRFTWSARCRRKLAYHCEYD